MNTAEIIFDCILRCVRGAVAAFIMICMCQIQALSDFARPSDSSKIPSVEVAATRNFYEGKLRVLEQKLADNYEAGLIEAQTLLRDFRLKNDLAGESQVYQLLGAFTLERPEAADYYFKALDGWRRLDRKIDMASTLIDLGELSRQDVNYEKAIDYLNQAYEVVGDQKDENILAHLFNRYAAVYYEISYNRPGMFNSAIELALDYARKSLAIAESLELDALIVNNLNIIGASDSSKGNIDTALENFNHAIEILDSHGWMHLKPNILNNLSNTLYSMDRLEEAIRFALESYQLSVDLGIDPYQEVATTILAKAYSKQSDYMSAFKYLQINSEIRHRMYYSERNRLFLELHEKYAVQEKENQIILERTYRQKERLYIVVLTAVLLFSIALVFIGSLKKKNTEIKKRNQQIGRQVKELERIKSEREKLFHQYQLALESADMGVWDMDILKNDLIWDSRMFGHFGMDPTPDSRPQPEWKTRIHPDDLNRVESMIREAVEGTGDFNLIFRVVLPDDRNRYLESHAMVLQTEKDHPYRMVGVVRDVTARIVADERRMESERNRLLTQRFESLGLMAGGIAHDFNNLLTAIIGNMDLIKRAVSPADPMNDLVDQSIDAAERAAELTRQILAYSGKDRPTFQNIELNPMIRHMVASIKSILPENIGFNLELCDCDTFLQGDPAQIQQIIMNLLTNAVEAIGDKDGTIILSTGAGDLDARYLSSGHGNELLSPGRYIWLDVNDSGTGMNPDVKQHIFDPFFTTKFTGRGLGMSEVLGIVRSHGGGVFIDSEPGKGSRIRIVFPSALKLNLELKSSPPTVELVTDDQSQLSGVILLVDDEDIVRLSCAAMLQAMGLTVLESSCGDEAIRIYSKSEIRIDVVILDLTMPGIDGITTFKLLKNIDPNVRILLSTGYNVKDYQKQLEGCQISGFISKPYHFEELFRIIKQMLISAESLD